MGLQGRPSQKKGRCWKIAFFRKSPLNIMLHIKNIWKKIILVEVFFKALLWPSVKIKIFIYFNQSASSYRFGLPMGHVFTL